MSKDSNSEFLKKIECGLIPLLSDSKINDVMNVIINSMYNYDLVEKETAVATMDDVDERIISTYLSCLYVNGRSPKTIYQYKRNLNSFLSSVNKSIKDVRVYDIRYYFAHEKQRGVSNITLENYRSTLSAFYTWLTNEGIIDKNIMLSIDTIKCPKKIKQQFSDVEIDALRSACKNDKQRAIIEVLLSTGVRVTELSEMKVDDIDFSNKTVNVQHGKGDKQRFTYISSIAIKYLKKYLETRKTESDYLFCNYRHTQLGAGGIRSLLKTVGEIAAVENVHPHRFRRTFATNLSNRGMNIQEIQKLLGHTNLNTTMKYVVVDDSRVKASYSKYIA